jgi:hypothetical protein
VGDRRCLRGELIRLNRKGAACVDFITLAHNRGCSAGALSADARRADKLPAVVADMDAIYTLADGRQFTSKGRYYRSKDGLIREDSPLGAIITDIKSGTMTMLNFERREAHVIKVAASSRAASAKDVPKAARYADATVDGRKVSKARAENGKGEAGILAGERSRPRRVLESELTDCNHGQVAAEYHAEATRCVGVQGAARLHGDEARYGENSAACDAN